MRPDGESININANRVFEDYEIEHMIDPILIEGCAETCKTCDVIAYKGTFDGVNTRHILTINRVNVDFVITVARKIRAEGGFHCGYSVTLTIQNDRFDFNPGNRGFVGEALTLFGYLAQTAAGYREFAIVFVENIEKRGYRSCH